MAKRPERNCYVRLNLGLMKIRLVSASGLSFSCLQQTHLSSPSLPTGRQAQDGVFRCNLNSYRPGDLVGIPDRIHDVLSLSGVTDEIEVGEMPLEQSVNFLFGF